MSRRSRRASPKRFVGGSSWTWPTCCPTPATTISPPPRQRRRQDSRSSPGWKSSVIASDKLRTWTQAFLAYTAALVSEHPSATLELLAYGLTIIKASQQYDGLYWRTYGTHFRINYTRFFTGRAKPAVACSVCDSIAHSEQTCPLKSGQFRPRKAPIGGAPHSKPDSAVSRVCNAPALIYARARASAHSLSRPPRLSSLLYFIVMWFAGSMQLVYACALAAGMSSRTQALPRPPPSGV